MSRNVTIAPGEYYHIYNRGTDKRKIFLNPKNYQRFLALLYICNSEYPVSINFRGRTSEIYTHDRGETLVDICVYCLMPNHFHLLIKEREVGGISKFMQKLTTGYTMYFNRLNDRNGSLFQGKFKASHVDKDTYLSYLISYIHINPVKIIDPLWKENGIRNKKSAEKFLDNYKYSSFTDYCADNRYEKAILSMNSLPKYHKIPNDFKSTVSDWLDYPTEVEPR